MFTKVRQEGRAVKACDGAAGSYEAPSQPAARRLAGQAGVSDEALAEVPAMDGPRRMRGPAAEAKGAQE